MTATLEYIEIEEDIVKLEKDSLAKCNESAMKHLTLSKHQLTRSRKFIPSLKSFRYYERGPHGGSLLVCVDGSLLFAASFVTPECHEMAFRNGLRTRPELLIERKKLNLD